MNDYNYIQIESENLSFFYKNISGVYLTVKSNHETKKVEAIFCSG